MLTIECTKCGEKLSIPDSRPPEITCDRCHSRIKLSYHKVDSDETDDEYNSDTGTGKAGLLSRIKDGCKNAATGVWDFTKKHYKEIIGAGILAGIAVWVMHANSQSDGGTAELPDSNTDFTPKDIPVKTPNDCPDAGNNPSDDEDDNEELTDWDYLSYSVNHCINCGSSLAGGYYTAPWEDDDNEYGYWECPCCGAINYDWNSADD